MRNSLLIILAFMVLPWTCEGKENAANREDARAGVVTSSSRGLHGYVGYSASRPPARANYSAGMGFYSAGCTASIAVPPTITGPPRVML
ncbi:MAG: hypothetical protein IIB56_15205 [Planctomycetes bacterium]|nr:hypothetical protein [Planctomycetota bacterium]MCH8118281.1 hypothetical protein [Planctomycetota bacterium]